MLRAPDVRLTILGSGTAIPDPHRNASGYLVDVGDVTLLIDAGPGTLRQLAKAGRRLDELDYLLFTHHHLDHTADLIPYFFALGDPRFEHLREIRIAGSTAFLEFFHQTATLYEKWVRRKDRDLILFDLSKQDLPLPGYSITSYPMAHIESSIGYRIESDNGKILSISGDTDTCDSAVALGRDADIYLLESSLPDELRSKGHLTPSLAGQVAEQAGCRLLILTHLYPECEQSDVEALCREHFSGEVVVARDFAVYEL